MKATVAAIHGIMTGGTDPSWPDRFEAWLANRASDMHVVTRRYHEGPFPWFNWVKNRCLARELANKLELFFVDYGGPGTQRPLWIVAHSNGACIALMVTRLLLARGKCVAGLILTGAACEADIFKSGVWKCLSHGKLGYAIAYSSVDDAVVAGDPSVAPWYWRFRDWVWGKLMWPYGCLGRTGWRCSGKEVPERGPYANKIFTRWYRGGHSSYFWPNRIEQTFEQFLSDILSSR